MTKRIMGIFLITILISSLLYTLLNLMIFIIDVKIYLLLVSLVFIGDMIMFWYMMFLSTFRDWYID